MGARVSRWVVEEDPRSLVQPAPGSSFPAVCGVMREWVPQAARVAKTFLDPGQHSDFTSWGLLQRCDNRFHRRCGRWEQRRPGRLDKGLL